MPGKQVGTPRRRPGISFLNFHGQMIILLSGAKVFPRFPEVIDNYQ
jgi:hypothetical protein